MIFLPVTVPQLEEAFCLLVGTPGREEPGSLALTL